MAKGVRLGVTGSQTPPPALVIQLDPLGHKVGPCLPLASAPMPLQVHLPAQREPVLTQGTPIVSPNAGRQHGLQRPRTYSGNGGNRPGPGPGAVGVKVLLGPCVGLMAVGI